MKTRVDARLRREAERHRFLFGCESCAYFAPESASCSHGYPNRAHLEVELDQRHELEFCKEFELA